VLDKPCQDIITRDKYLLDNISNELGIEYDINLLIENNFISVFESFEENRERLRILGVKPKDFTSLNEKNKTTREQIFSISKKKIKEQKLNLNLLRLKARLYTVIWKQLKLLKEVELTENTINTLKQQIQEIENTNDSKENEK